MNRLSLKGWLLLLPTALLGLLLGMSVLLVMQAGQGKALLDTANHRLAQRLTIASAASACSDITQRAIVWTMTRRVAERRLYMDAKTACAEQLASLVETVDDSQRDVVAQLTGRFTQLTSLLEVIQSEHEEESKMRTVGRLEREVKPISAEIAKTLDRLVVDGDTASQAALSDLADQKARGGVIGMVAGAVGLLLGGTITRVVLRRLLGALERARDAAQALASGDLSKPVGSHNRDEVGAMLASMENARVAWVQAIGDIRAASERIHITSSKIQQGVGIINGNTGDAAQRLGQTSDAMGQMLQRVDLSTQDALTAAKVAEEATAVASSGGQVVRDVASTMTKIQQASARISDINAVIDSIAFQTNILALNAAVEAARAGDQGRGFAVVASEVRALAKRSAQAAGEIRQLIDASVDQVRSGAERALGADTTIGTVCTSTEKVAQMIVALSQSASAQSSDIRSMATLIDEVTSSTRQNAETVQLWAGSAQQLERDADRLQELISRFRVPQSEAA